MSASPPAPPAASAPRAGATRRGQWQALLARQFGSPRALLDWGVERASWRRAGVRWLLASAGLVALILAWYTPGERSNLARHATVTLSSSCGITPYHSRDPAEPARLVDGKDDREYDACTAQELHPWVHLDLGQRAALQRVVIIGRKDCCWGATSLPLVLEISEDGENYQSVRRRSVPFTHDEPWRVRLDGQTARYLRLRSEADGPTDIVLNEIEVYGQAIAETPPSGSP